MDSERPVVRFVQGAAGAATLNTWISSYGGSGHGSSGVNGDIAATLMYQGMGSDIDFYFYDDKNDLPDSNYLEMAIDRITFYDSQSDHAYSVTLCQ